MEHVNLSAQTRRLEDLHPVLNTSKNLSVVILRGVSTMDPHMKDLTRRSNISSLHTRTLPQVSTSNVILPRTNKPNPHRLIRNINPTDLRYLLTSLPMFSNNSKWYSTRLKRHMCRRLSSSLPEMRDHRQLSVKRRNGACRRYLVVETSRLLQPVSPHLPPISWPPLHSSELSLVSIPLIDRLSTLLHHHSVMIQRRPRRKLPRELKSLQWHSEKRLLELNKRGHEPLCKSETRSSGIESMENQKPTSSLVEQPVGRVDQRPIRGVRLNKLLYPLRPCMDDTLLRDRVRDWLQVQVDPTWALLLLHPISRLNAPMRLCLPLLR
jgi:hypothetical protein